MMHLGIAFPEFAICNLKVESAARNLTDEPPAAQSQSLFNLGLTQTPLAVSMFDECLAYRTFEADQVVIKIFILSSIIRLQGNCIRFIFK